MIGSAKEGAGININREQSRGRRARLPPTHCVALRHENESFHHSSVPFLHPPCSIGVVESYTILKGHTKHRRGAFYGHNSDRCCAAPNDRKCLFAFSASADQNSALTGRCSIKASYFRVISLLMLKHGWLPYCSGATPAL